MSRAGSIALSQDSADKILHLAELIRDQRQESEAEGGWPRALGRCNGRAGHIVTLIQCAIRSAERDALRARVAEIETAIQAKLTEMRWRPRRNYGGELELMSPDSEWMVTVGIDGWALGKFTDGDIDGVAVGRFPTVESGETVEELEIAIQEFVLKGAMK